MSSWELNGYDTWGGAPVAHEIAKVVPRGRFVVTGEIRTTGTTTVGRSEAFSCELDDGTGVVTLLFPGRRAVAGLAAGARCTVEATARLQRGRLVAWGPLYRLEARSCHDGA